MKNTNPIGVFDSGFGGLSVWIKLVDQMPNESIVYFADSANCPYGPKTQYEIIELSKKITEFLIEKQCKIIVVACNTATAAAIEYLRANYPITFIGMEPAVKPAAQQSKTGNIGILATKGTLEGRLFKETSQKYTHNMNVHIQIGEGLVEKVESGDLNSDSTLELLKKYLNPMIDCKIDHLVLGCTHYPFLTEIIRKITGDELNIVNPANAIAVQTQKKLAENNLLNHSKSRSDYEFYLNNGNKEILDVLVKQLNTNIVYESYIISNF
jgi:glutamate racemase